MKYLQENWFGGNIKPTGECTCGDGFKWDENDLRCEIQPQFLYVESECGCLGGWSIFFMILLAIAIVAGLASCLCACKKFCSNSPY